MDTLTVTNIKPFRGFLEIYGHKKPELVDHLDSEIAAYQPHQKKIALQSGDLHPNLEFDTIYLGLSLGSNKYHRCTVLEKRANNKAIIELIDYGINYEVDTNLLLELDPKNQKGEFLINFPSLASKYILANFFCNWKLNELDIIESLLKRSTLLITNEQTDREFCYISLNYGDMDLASKLINSQIGMEISFTEQRMAIKKLTQRFDVFANVASAANGAGSPARREKRRNLVATRPLQATTNNNNIITNEGKQLIQSYIAPKTLRASFQPEANQSDIVPLPTSISRTPAFTAKELSSNCHHVVYCSYIENGPNEFYVQLKSQEHVLDRLASDLSSVPRVQLMSKMPINMACIGMACIARFSEDQNLYRAVIHKVHTNGCRVIFVDYGNSELVPLNELYEIPLNFLEHKTFAMPFELYRCKELGPIDDRLKKAFTELIKDATLELKVIPSTKSTAQQCELFLPNGRNVLHCLIEKKNELNSYPNPPHLKDGDKVIIRSALTAKKFFVQRVKDLTAFDRMMDALLAHCVAAPQMTTLPPKDTCCAAMVNGDPGEWYRVIVTNQVSREHVQVYVVDYGHEMKCHLTDLRNITPQFLELSRQAIECCLADFDDVTELPESTREKLELFIDDTNGDPIEYKISMRRQSPNSPYVVDLTNNTKEVSVSLSVYKLAMPRLRNNYGNKAPPKSSADVEKPPRTTAPTNRANNWQNVREIDGAEMQERYNEAIERQKERFGNKSSNVDNTRFERAKPKNEPKSPMSNGASRNYGNRPEYDNRRNGDMNKKPILQKHIIPRFNKRPNRSRNNHNGKRTIGHLCSLDKNDNWENSGVTETSGIHCTDSPSKSSERVNNTNNNNKPLQMPPLIPITKSIGEQIERETEREIEEQNEQKTEEQIEQKTEEQIYQTIEEHVEQSIQQEIEQPTCSELPKITKESVSVHESTAESVESMPVQKTPSTSIVDKEFVFVTHVDHPNRFYVQKNSDTDELESFQQTLQIVAPKLPALQNFRAGELCIGKYACDDQWYRARIIDNDGEITSIQFIDYGNTDSITDNSLLKSITDDALIAREPFAMACSLLIAPHGSNEWTEDACNKLRMLTNDLPLEFELISKDKDVNQVKLFFDDGRDLVEEMIQEQVEPSIQQEDEQPTNFDLSKITEESVSVQENTVESVETIPVQRAPTTPIVDRELVFVTHVDHPNRFYIQKNSDTDELQSFEQTLQIVAPQLPPLQNFRAGELCIGKYAFDDQWYRARIIDSDGEITSIQFIDYGNTDSITDNSLLKSITDDALIAREPFAMACSLPIAPHGSSEWAEAACNKLRMLSNGESPMEFELISKDKNVNYVKLFFVGGRDLVKEMIQEEVADPLEIIKLGEPCFVSHINSLSDFFIQVDSDSEVLAKIEQHLNSDNGSVVLEAPTVGTICSALFEDGQFYRARILNILSDSKYDVEFLDYGNTFQTTEVRSLSPEITQLPHLRKRCNLKLPDDIESWSDAAEQKFREISSEGATEFNVHLIKPGKKACVELYLGDQNISAVLGELCKKRRMPIITEDEHDSLVKEITSPQQHSVNVSDFPSGKQHCVLTHINSPADFYVQFYSKQEDLTVIQMELANAYEQEALEQIDIGSTVAALYPEDGYFYRAKVLDTTPEGTVVMFIDYGNTCTVKDIRKLSSIISTIVPLAAHCTLENDRLTEFTSADTEAFWNFMAEEPEPTFQVEAISTTANKTTVKFYRDDKDILEFIRTGGSSIDPVATTVLSDIIEISININV